MFWRRVVEEFPLGNTERRRAGPSLNFTTAAHANRCSSSDLRLGVTAPMNRLTLLAVSCLLVVGGCKARQGERSKKAEPSASASASTAVHSGPTGVIKGVVRISGDEPLPAPLASTIPVGKCFKAHERHKLLFRKAADGGVADVLVAVTGYEGDVPKPTSPVNVTMEDCSFETRTIAMTFGQSIHVKNRGPRAGMPQLVGVPTPAVLAAIPGGDPIVLTPHVPGQFQLVDRSNPFAEADVYVVHYPTIAVTDEQGRFEIPGVPVGTAKVSILMPATGLTEEREVKVTAGQLLDLSFELKFDKATHEAAVELGRRLEKEAEEKGNGPQAE